MLRLGLLQPEAVLAVVDLEERVGAFGDDVALLAPERLDDAGDAGEDLGFFLGFEGGGRRVVARDAPDAAAATATGTGGCLGASLRAAPAPAAWAWPAASFLAGAGATTATRTRASEIHIRRNRGVDLILRTFFKSGATRRTGVSGDTGPSQFVCDSGPWARRQDWTAIIRYRGTRVSDDLESPRGLRRPRAGL